MAAAIEALRLHPTAEIRVMSSSPLVKRIDPVPVLRRLLASLSPVERLWDGPDDFVWTCVCCGRTGPYVEDGYARTWFPHASDCPYEEAILLFGDPNVPGAPTGILKA